MNGKGTYSFYLVLAELPGEAQRQIKLKWAIHLRRFVI